MHTGGALQGATRYRNMPCSCEVLRFRARKKLQPVIWLHSEARTEIREVMRRFETSLVSDSSGIARRRIQVLWSTTTLMPSAES